MEALVKLFQKNMTKDTLYSSLLLIGVVFCLTASCAQKTIRQTGFLQLPDDSLDARNRSYSVADDNLSLVKSVGDTTIVLMPAGFRSGYSASVYIRNVDTNFLFDRYAREAVGDIISVDTSAFFYTCGNRLMLAVHGFDARKLRYTIRIYNMLNIEDQIFGINYVSNSPSISTERKNYFRKLISSRWQEIYRKSDSIGMPEQSLK